VIFCVALGSNGIAVATSNRASLEIVNAAFAQTSDGPVSLDKAQVEKCANLTSMVSDAKKAGASDSEILKLIEPYQAISKQILEDKQVLGGSNSQIKSNDFFAPWLPRGIVPRP
jgi:hypothetical protein